MTTRYGHVLAVLCAAAIAGCSDYDKNAAQDITAPVSGANVKFFNLGVNAPGMNFFANDTKVTAISSTSCSPAPTTPNPLCSSTGVETLTGTTYGNLAAGGFYNTVPAGSVTLKGKIAPAPDSGLVAANVAATLESGKFYSFYTSGIYNTATKTSEAFYLEDALPAFDWANAYVRFVNASSNAGSMTLYAKNQTTGTEAPVGAAVAYKSGGAFTQVVPGVYDLSVRSSVTGTNLATLASQSFGAGRVYTITLRGDATVTSTTATTRPILQNNSNR